MINTENTHHINVEPELQILDDPDYKEQLLLTTVLHFESSNSNLILWKTKDKDHGYN